jgi:fermentation-respiration switch protein FrsA (DUF1100 family)
MSQFFPGPGHSDATSGAAFNSTRRDLMVGTGATLVASIAVGGLGVSEAMAAAPPAPSDKVTVERVTFKNRLAIVLAGDLYVPKSIDRSRKYKAIAVGHPFGGVKEQTAGLHAQKLAELGYVTLAFDASFYGDSGGQPRNIEVPEIRVEDYSAAVDVLSNHPLADAARIGVLGICGGGIYAVNAAQIDHRIKALATISMFDLGRLRREGLRDVMSVTDDARMKILDDYGAQRSKEFADGNIRYINAIQDSWKDADQEILRQYYDYYRNPARGQLPNSRNEYSFTSMGPMINFIAFEQVKTISPRPLLFIVGDRASSAYFSEDAYAKASEPKELFVVPDAQHFDLYDKPECLAVTLPKLDKFFGDHLA